jgi:GNAT superfamily N-acetyltransferase
VTPEPALRPATAADAGELARTVAEGFASYREFAPDGWSPPEAAQEAASLRGHFADADFFCVLAEAGGAPVGHVAFMPASHSRSPSGEPGLAHFFQLFVRRPWWGSGVARRLHGAAIDEAARRGYTAMRLFTPEHQARARRFYEREGWRLASAPRPAPGLGLDIVEYRRRLGDARSSAR